MFGEGTEGGKKGFCVGRAGGSATAENTGGRAVAGVNKVMCRGMCGGVQMTEEDGFTSEGRRGTQGRMGAAAYRTGVGSGGVHGWEEVDAEMAS